MNAFSAYPLKTICLLLIIQVQLSSQNVGIGTNTPSSKLHLKSTVQSITSLDLDFETGTIDPVNISGSYDWYITGTDGSNSVKSAKAPLMFSNEGKAFLSYIFNMSLGKEITVSFDYKYEDPDDEVSFFISSDGFSLTPPSDPNWKSYSTSYISQSTSDALKIGVQALQAEAFPIVHVDNIIITYEDGHVLKIEDGTEDDGHFLQSDALGHTEWYDLRGEIDQKISDNLQNLDFDTTQNALFIEGGNGVLISSLKNDFGKTLRLSGNEILGSPGMSLYLPNPSNNSSFQYDADNNTMDWGIGNNYAKGAHSTRWGSSTTASNLYDTSWGQASVASGGLSTAWGQANWSLGYRSTSWGDTNTVNGEDGTAWGRDNDVSGSKGTAWGESNDATELLSTTFGRNNLSSGELATTWGENNIANDIYSTAWGSGNTASNNYSTSWGQQNSATALRSTTWGYLNEASGNISTSFGDNNLSSGTLTTSWGENNTASASHTTVWGSSNSASGSRSTAWGSGNGASGIRSTAWGSDNSALGARSTVWGLSNTVSFDDGTAWGSSNTVDGGRGTAWGFANEVTTSGIGSTACGLYNIVNGRYAFVSGNQNEGNSFAEVAFGRWNESPDGNATSWVSDDMLFSLGNGSSDANRKNAVSVLKNGNVGIGINAPTYDLHMGFNSAAKPGSSSWTVSSDQRLKKDITKFTDGLDIISAIEPVWFTYNGLANIPEGTYVGTIAQDLEEVAPYMVSEFTHRDDEGNSENYKAVNYGAMDFVLINAIKEQQLEIAELKAQIVEIMTLLNSEKSIESNSDDE